MDIKRFNEEANAILVGFNELRAQLREYAFTEEGNDAIAAVDKSAARKLRGYPGDITPARLVSISTKLLSK